MYICRAAASQPVHYKRRRLGICCLQPAQWQLPSAHPCSQTVLRSKTVQNTEATEPQHPMLQAPAMYKWAARLQRSRGSLRAGRWARPGLLARPGAPAGEPMQRCNECTNEWAARLYIAAATACGRVAARSWALAGPAAGGPTRRACTAGQVPRAPGRPGPRSCGPRSRGTPWPSCGRRTAGRRRRPPASGAR